MLFRPLFWSSFWCEDWLFSSSYRGAKRVLISSASAKTAFCLAFCIKRRIRKAGLDTKLVGLTSQKHHAFTQSLGLYDEVADYSDLGNPNPTTLRPGAEKWLYIDVAGNGDTNSRIKAHFDPCGNPLVAAISLGTATLTPLPSGETPRTSQDTLSLEPFFTPEWLGLRKQQLPPAEFGGMQAKAWHDFIAEGMNWVRFEHVYGGENVLEAYQKFVNGGMGPDEGMIWSLGSREEKVRVALARV